MDKKEQKQTRLPLAKNLLLLLVLLLAAAGAVIWHVRDELKSLEAARQYTAQELEEQLNENNQTVQDKVERSNDITVRLPTKEERQALRDGELTSEELTDQLTAPEEAEAEEVQAQTQTLYQAALSELVAKTYVLRESYTNALEEMEDAAIADYRSLKANGGSLASLVTDYLGQATALEKQCDQEMDDIVAQMQVLISENNGDMTLVDTVIQAYANEKSLKKAWYMSRLKEKGLI